MHSNASLRTVRLPLRLESRMGKTCFHLHISPQPVCDRHLESLLTFLGWRLGCWSRWIWIRSRLSAFLFSLVLGRGPPHPTAHTYIHDRHFVSVVEAACGVMQTRKSSSLCCCCDSCMWHIVYSICLLFILFVYCLLLPAGGYTILRQLRYCFCIASILLRSCF